MLSEVHSSKLTSSAAVRVSPSSPGGNFKVPLGMFKFGKTESGNPRPRNGNATANQDSQRPAVSSADADGSACSSGPTSEAERAHDGTSEIEAEPDVSEEQPPVCLRGEESVGQPSRFLLSCHNSISLSAVHCPANTQPSLQAYGSNACRPLQFHSLPCTPHVLPA